MEGDPARSISLGLLILLCAACGSAPDVAPGTAGEPTGSVPADEAVLLPHPFTAEQIREEMTVGLVLKIHRMTPAGDAMELWEVVAADIAGVEIEFTEIDPDGNPVGESHRTRSSWTELRDHAAFAAASARREELRRETTFGELDGWLYRVGDPAAGATSEFFFARDLPGPPVHMITTRNGELVQEMVQIERQRAD